jgi:hypothetical protein
MPCQSRPYRPVLRYFLIEYGKEILRKLLRSQSKVEEKEDISIIIYGAAVYKCLEAANELAKIGIEAEVVEFARFTIHGRSHFLGFRFKHIGQLLWKKPGVPSVFLLKYRLE